MCWIGKTHSFGEIRIAGFAGSECLTMWVLMGANHPERLAHGYNPSPGFPNPSVSSVLALEAALGETARFHPCLNSCVLLIDHSICRPYHFEAHYILGLAGHLLTPPRLTQSTKSLTALDGYHHWQCSRAIAAPSPASVLHLVIHCWSSGHTLLLLSFPVMEGVYIHKSDFWALEDLSACPYHAVPENS